MFRVPMESHAMLTTAGGGQAGRICEDAAGYRVRFSVCARSAANVHPRPSDLLTIHLRFGDDECCWLATQAKHCSATTGSIGFNGPLNYADDGNLVSVCFVGGEGKTVSPNA